MAGSDFLFPLSLHPNAEQVVGIFGDVGRLKESQTYDTQLFTSIANPELRSGPELSLL